MPDLQRRTNTGMTNSNALRIGMFGANCSSGMAVTSIDERWGGFWDSNLEVAKMADECGIEFMLPIGRWRGYGGKTDFQHYSLETITWACGLLAQTEQISAFCTIHTPLVHPVFAAKQFTTVDQISHGRFGINVVSGWNTLEFRMFGEQLAEHDARYRFSAEWLDVVRNIWANEDTFDYAGDFFNLQQVIGDPKPFGDTEPFVMSAGSSPAGRNFATQNCDAIFMLIEDWETAGSEIERTKAQARAHGREIDVYTSVHVVCRPTTAEAIEFREYYARENADWEAVENLMRENGMNTLSVSRDHYERYRDRWAGGHGTFPIIGDPDTCAKELARLAEVGYAGVAVGLVDYAAEFPTFRDEIMPRLEHLGARQPFKTPVS